ncbi:hypothetical protein [Streptomyces sp. NBC_00557]|uniref:hypothetical protein n=1 Tax=Streptomyces sp. NBC_00557 TaxID=2975776 RepID=UPI002E81ED62|nr:hypothetical protein [Streptomyces sp. NBC_00557]WUC33716.1 hypothetical protein OG956_05570 [Streptomyces sp. NBC_00557]
MAVQEVVYGVHGALARAERLSKPHRKAGRRPPDFAPRSVKIGYVAQQKLTAHHRACRFCRPEWGIDPP